MTIRDRVIEVLLSTLMPKPPAPLPAPGHADINGPADIIHCPSPGVYCDHPEEGYYHQDGRRCTGWRHWLHI